MNDASLTSTIPSPVQELDADCQREEPTSNPPAQAAPAIERDALFADFKPLVRRLVHQYGDDPDLRQELPGEIYCQFIRLLNAFDPGRGNPLKPYLVRNLTMSIHTFARHHYRKRRYETLHANAGEARSVEGMHDPTSDWVQSLTRRQVGAELPAAIASLPGRQRQVVILRYYENRTFEEIANGMSIAVATARSLLRHGINNLREQLQLLPCIDVDTTDL